MLFLRLHRISHMLRAFYGDLALHSITNSPVQTKSSLLWRLLARRILDRSFFILSEAVFDPALPVQDRQDAWSPIEPHKSLAPPHDQKCFSPTANSEIHSIPTPITSTVTSTDMNKMSTKAELEHDLSITDSFCGRDAAIQTIRYSPVMSL